MPRVRPALATSPRAARLFGRARVLAEIREALACGAPVTLVGVAGVGKTELALHLAATVEHSVFVDLGSAREHGDVQACVANTLDVRVGREPLAALRAALGARAATLVLDRCDAVIDEVRALAATLAGACDVVCTCGQPLDLPDERVISIDPLVEDGVELFRERRGGAEPSRRERDATRRVVDACGGLPFAIELAASADLTVVELGDQLDRIVDRNRPVRDVVGWALASVEPAVADAVAQASVFEGPFSLDAFEAVVRLPDASALDVLSRAVSRGLVARAPGADDATRLLVPPHVRGPALELLTDEERLTALRRHAAFFARSGERSRADRLAAFEVALLDDTPEILVHLVDVLVPSLLREGAFERAEAIVEAASAITPKLSVPRALVAEARGIVAPPCEDPLVAAEIALRRDDARAALALSTMMPSSSVRALRVQGDAHRRLGEAREAAALYRAAVDLARRLDQQITSAEMLVRLAGAELDLGAPERAQPHLADAIDVLARAEDERPWAIALATLADLLLEEGDDTGVDALLVEARLHARRAGALDVLARIDVLTASRALSVGLVENVPALLAAQREAPGSFGDLARGLEAAYRARVDDRDGAAEALPNGPCAAPLLGVLELAEARLARVQGADDAPLLTRARERLGAAALPRVDVRVSRRVLARTLAGAARATIHREGSWFSIDGAHVSFERRASFRRILGLLLRRRVEAPGVSVPEAQLVEVGWPGERLAPRVLADRLHTAMQTMRDLGLRGLLEHDRGFRLRAEITIDVA